jgi:hypothetical protein
MMCVWKMHIMGDHRISSGFYNYIVLELQWNLDFTDLFTTKFSVMKNPFLYCYADLSKLWQNLWCLPFVVDRGDQFKQEENLLKRKMFFSDTGLHFIVFSDKLKAVRCLLLLLCWELFSFRCWMNIISLTFSLWFAHFFGWKYRLKDDGTWLMSCM